MNVTMLIQTVFDTFNKWLGRDTRSSDYERFLVKFAANEFKKNPELLDELLHLPLERIHPELLPILKQAVIEADKDGVALQGGTKDLLKRLDERIKVVAAKYPGGIEAAAKAEEHRLKIAHELDRLLKTAKQAQPVERGRLNQQAKIQQEPDEDGRPT